MRRIGIIAASILLFLSSMHLFADQQIQGTVVDEQGEPVIGATIVVKDSPGIGVATDVDGKFSLSVPEDCILIISFVGYKSQEVEAAANMFITLEPETEVLQEVLVTGIFTRVADSYTGAVSAIKSEDIEKVSNQNILHALKNIEPSFQALESMDFGSDPNRMPDLQMRGASSFTDMKDKYRTNPNQPLFIVDGFEQSIEKVMDMDMNRVASITLLKDATAKALYGSKGANGIVVIETLVPDKGKLRVSYSGSVDIQSPDLTSYNLANAVEKLEIEKNAGVYTDAGRNPIYQQPLDEKYQYYHKEVLRGVDTYWLSQPLRVGVGQKHSLNFEGGDDIVRYGIDFQYNNVAGVMKGSGRNVLSGGFNFQYRHRSLLFMNRLSLTFNKSHDSPYGTFSEYAKLNPYWRPYNEDGTVKEVLADYEQVDYWTHPIYNPLCNASINTKNSNEYSDVTNNFYIEWSAFSGMKFRGRLGVIAQKNGRETFYPKDHTMFKNIQPDSEEYFERGRYNMGNGENFSYNADISANYSKEIGKHVIFSNAQWSFSEDKREYVEFAAQGFANNKMDYITNAKEYITGSPTGMESLVRETSALLSANYSYDERYLFDLTYRANASSLFGSDKRWGHFHSAGIGWNVHHEAFLRGAKDQVQRMRLRASTGSSGSQNFNSYQAIATYRFFNESYDNIVGSYLLGLANDDLQWQKTRDNNVGIDLDLFHALSLSFDYYIKDTENLLTPVSLPPSAGFTSYTENLGETRNKGFEGKLNYRLIRDTRRNIYLNLFVTAMHNQNTIRKISDALTSINEVRDKEKQAGGGTNPDLENRGEVAKPSVRYQEGQSMDAIWGVKSLGIDPVTGREVFLTRDGEMTYDWRAEDQVVIGNRLPKLRGTFGFNFNLKGFSLNSSFAYRLGGQVYNQTLVDKVENVDMQYNVDKRVLSDRWTTPGVPAKFKRFNESDPITRPTSRFIQDVRELQMTSLSIGYDFRYDDFIRKANLEQLKVMLYMNDIFHASTVRIERGILYPFARSFSLSVQATF